MQHSSEDFGDVALGNSITMQSVHVHMRGRHLSSLPRNAADSRSWGMGVCRDWLLCNLATYVLIMRHASR